MRPYLFLNVAMIWLAACVVALGFAGFASAQDMGASHRLRRPHHHQAQQASQDIQSRSYRHHERRGRDHFADRDRFERRHVERRHFERRHVERRYSQGYRRPHSRLVIREVRGYDRDNWERGYDGNDFPSTAPGGTYAGAISAWNEPGNGTYFDIDRYGYSYGDDAVHAPRSRAKIIRVNPRNAGRACSWESGVCVIRGR